ncbi:glycine cleavage system transcriptional repressor [Malonomonas rubra DSM 5091]|uniref:Glycine cleavage system transcriptional repressor n=1 Tax=Malonomonas rubra DSM 5091 TaxID=1122189 RepID=A0A1M6IBS1_MALRU|nr:ACT domain-containing protein [Malonomonas rubra]SHJ31883.1 glycine cleavage system transcriptional repressor [Malonomonas rubra DSM 5091]
MANRYIMTAFGKDRVGIVADVTRLLYENECNLEDTSMSMLADEFTLSLLFSSPRADIEEHLAKECRRLEMEKAISAFVRPLQAAQQQARKGYKTCTLHIEGLDQAGIVFKTSQFLADNKLNIIRLNSTAKASPESGVPIYCMDIHIQVPEEVPLDDVEDKLMDVADELHVDVLLSR